MADAISDRGIWATWYDVAEEGRDDFLTWLHDLHLPEMLERPGYMWAAHYRVIGGARDNAMFSPEHADDAAGIGKGKDFLMLVGAASPHVFCNPSLAQLAERQSAETAAYLARRLEVRPCIFVEEARIDGPAVGQRPQGSAPGPAIQMGSLNMQSIEAEFELGAWYAQDRLPATAAMPGCIGTRKLVSTAGWAKHSVLYEFVSHEARESQFKGHERGESEAESWGKRVINSTIHAPGSPSIGTRLWPAIEE